MFYLRYNTASQEIPLGFFLNSGDGDSEETGLTIANTDILLWKTGATALASKNSGGATHMSNGIYYAVLDATDTDTIGPMKVFVHVSGALAVELPCCVLPALVYDSLIAGTDALQVDTIEISGDATAADNLELLLDRFVTGTAQSGSSTGIILAAGESAVDNRYRYWTIVLTGGTGAGQMRAVIAYQGSSKGLTVVPDWDTNPDNTTTYLLIPISTGANVFAVDGNAENGVGLGSLASDYYDLGYINARITEIITNAVNADALAADAVAEIQTGLATSADQTTILNRLGAITGSGVNTVLGFFKALLSKTASIPSDIGGTFDPVTDSVEAIRDRGDAAWVTGSGGTPPELLIDTTIATLASQTSFTLTDGSTDNDAYNSCVAVVTDQSTATQKAVGVVSDYVGVSKTITLKYDPGIFTMAVGDTIQIMALSTALLTNMPQHGGEDAVINLERLIIESKTDGEPGIKSTGKGYGHGVSLIGGTTGAGLSLLGDGGSSGLVSTSNAGNGNGAHFVGTGSGAGLRVDAGITGHGLDANGGATSGSGIKATAPTSGDGIEAVGAGASGAGIKATGASNGNGITATGNGVGSGIKGTGGATGAGITGSAGATSGHGIEGIGSPIGAGIFGQSDDTDYGGIHGDNQQDGPGIYGIGQGAGSGMKLESVAGGYGLELVGDTADILGTIEAGNFAAGAIDANALASDAANEIADALLSRNVSNVEASAPEHSLCTIILATLESSISGTTWTIKRTNGVTTHATKTVTLDAAADPIVGVA